MKDVIRNFNNKEEHEGEKGMVGAKIVNKQFVRNMGEKVKVMKKSVEKKRKSIDELELDENLAVKHSKAQSSKSERDSNIFNYLKNNTSLTRG